MDDNRTVLVNEPEISTNAFLVVVAGFVDSAGAPPEWGDRLRLVAEDRAPPNQLSTRDAQQQRLDARDDLIRKTAREYYGHLVDACPIAMTMWTDLTRSNAVGHALSSFAQDKSTAISNMLQLCLGKIPASSTIRDILRGHRSRR
jgi:hypothetical protein